MSQVEQLEIAVKALPKDEFATFKKWLLEYDEQCWDEQIEKDSQDPNSPIMKLAAKAILQAKKPRQPGTLRGTVLHMSPDFDAPLDDFKEYME